MSIRITVNPLTRISGFLEIEVEISGSKIVEARSSGVLFRGFEKMLRGRPPLDAIYFTERICGICSTAHSMASSLALESALNIKPVRNDLLIRDFMHGCEFLQNHLRHFYQYTMPDYVKISGLELADSASHNDFRLPDKLNSKLSDHYIASLKYSRLAHEMLATLGGKAPHNHGIFAGRVTVNMDSYKLESLKSMLQEIHSFINNISFEDADIITTYYSDYYNKGRGYGNFLSYGCFQNYSEGRSYVNQGVYINGQFLPFNSGLITEKVHSSWYKSDKAEISPGVESALEEDLGKEAAYSWVKSPRYEGLPMEVGPLARLWLNGTYRRGISAMDRTVARVIEAERIADVMNILLEQIKPQPTEMKAHLIPDEADGTGLIDTTRGALGHWVSIKGGTIEHYDIITPSGWNLSPKDENGLYGTVEMALVGTEINDASQPVEIGRIVRTFDPCVSCATHITGENISSMRIRIL